MSLASLNLSAASNEGRPMTVLHPVDRTPLKDAKGKPLTIDLLGKDSDTFIRAENAARNKAVETLTKGVKFSAAEASLEGAQSLARAVTGWSGIPKAWVDGSDDETPVSFDYETAVAMFSNPGVRWLRDQADEFVGTRAHFLTASPKP